MVNMIKFFFSKTVISEDNIHFVFMIMIKKIFEQLCRKLFSGFSHGGEHVSMLEHVWGGVFQGHWERDLKWKLLKSEGALNIKYWVRCEIETYF